MTENCFVFSCKTEPFLCIKATHIPTDIEIKLPTCESHTLEIFEFISDFSEYYRETRICSLVEPDLDIVE